MDDGQRSQLGELVGETLLVSVVFLMIWPH